MLRRLFVYALLLSLFAFFAPVAVAEPDVFCQVDTRPPVDVLVDLNVALSAQARIPIEDNNPDPPYYCPNPDPQNRWPMIISLHGGGGMLDVVETWAEHNAELGYIGVIFVWRGFQGSQGAFNLEEMQEWEDLNEITKFFVEDYAFTAGKVDSAHIGLEGISMGAAHSWMGATQSGSVNWLYPYSSVVPIDSSPYPQNYWVVNGCIHNGVTNWFENLRITWNQTTLDALQDYYDNYDDDGLQTFLSAEERDYSEDIPFIPADTHVYEIGSWTDAFQHLDKSLTAFETNLAEPKAL